MGRHDGDPQHDRESRTPPTPSSTGCSTPQNHAQVAELVLYKVPNPDAMAMLDPALLEQFPNLAMTPAELLEQEQLVDIGEATLDYTDIVAEVTAS